MKLEIKGYDNAVIELNRLISENKWAITILNPEADNYVIQYHEHKKYLSSDGNEYYDEVWTNSAGDITFVQDMNIEDMRTALRFFLYEERLLREEMLAASITNDSELAMNKSEKITIH